MPRERKWLLLLTLVCVRVMGQGQGLFPHPNAHAHNDYEHKHPLKDAMTNGFISVEADVHMRNGNLVVAHNMASDQSPRLEKLYLFALDSILRVNQGNIYTGFKGTFYLMLDIKSNGETTYKAIRNTLDRYPALLCRAANCPIRIFLSGERPAATMIGQGYSGIGIDGRPSDVGKGYSVDVMPVISDTFKNWSSWDGRSVPREEDLQKLRELAARVHAEGKKLRLWAIPDHEEGWEALLNSGVDLINTDQLEKLNHFLAKKGL